VELPSSLVPTLALHLPKLSEHLTRGDPYNCNEMSFRMQTVAKNSARISIDRASTILKLPELEYLPINLTTLANQLARYKLAEDNVCAYAQSAAGATTFVHPTEPACRFVQYDVLFEEINRYMWP
jgi:hypothetical protein